MGIEMGTDYQAEMAPEQESLRRTWRCSVCDALHVDDGGSILHAIPWDRHAHVGASRRRWIDAAVSVLDPEWNGSPDDLGAALRDAIAAAERRGYERGIREAAEVAEERRVAHLENAVRMDDKGDTITASMHRKRAGVCGLILYRIRALLDEGQQPWEEE